MNPKPERHKNTLYIKEKKTIDSVEQLQSLSHDEPLASSNKQQHHLVRALSALMEGWSDGGGDALWEREV